MLACWGFLLSMFVVFAEMLSARWWKTERLKHRWCAFYSRRFCRDEASATKLITSDTRDEIPRSSLARIENCHGGIVIFLVRKLSNHRFARFAFFFFDRHLRALRVNRKLSAHAISTSHSHMRILHNSDRLYLSGRHSSIREHPEHSNTRGKFSGCSKDFHRRQSRVALAPLHFRVFEASKSDRFTYRRAKMPGNARIFLADRDRLDAIRWQEKKWEIRASRRYRGFRLNSLDERTKFARERDLLLREFLLGYWLSLLQRERLLASFGNAIAFSRVFDTFTNLVLIALRYRYYSHTPIS